jgi:ATP-dependent RNA helicase DeaD
MTDVEAKLINRITVRELSSFFNVPHSAAEFIEASLSKAKYNNRRVRVEEADQKSRGFGDKGPRDYQSKPGKSNNINKNNNTDKPKYQRARKPLK